MQLVDTHCHIQSIGETLGEKHTRELWAKAESLTPDNVIERAVQAGVTKLLCVGCDLEDSILSINFVKNRPNCWSSIGLHPHEAKRYIGINNLKTEFTALAMEEKVVAIGECGLDYFYNHSDKQDQIEILEFQLDLAKKHNLPLVFHVREAFNDFWPILDNFKGLKGVLHSFTDNLANLEKGLARDLYFGVNGIATFAKDIEQIEVYKQIPLSSLLLETDSPFLTPAPYRGTINEPSKVETVARFMAELRGEDLTSLSNATTFNASKLFEI